MPIRFAHRLGRGKKLGRLAGVDALLPLLAHTQQLEAAIAELALQQGDEIERFGAQDLPAARGGRAFDLDLAGGRHEANVQAPAWLASGEALQHRRQLLGDFARHDHVRDAVTLAARRQVIDQLIDRADQHVRYVQHLRSVHLEP